MNGIILPIPELVTVIFDILSLMIVAYAGIQVIKSEIGGVAGAALRFTLIGIAILAVNRFLDTLYFSDLVQMYSKSELVVQISLLHKSIDFIGFAFIALGFSKLVSSRGGTQ